MIKTALDRKTSTPLDVVTAKLAGGSRAALARLLAVNRSTVTGWANRRQGELKGCIPQRYHALILELSRNASAGVTANDLMHPVTETQPDDGTNRETVNVG